MAFSAQAAPQKRRPAARSSKVQTADFDSALLDVMSRSMDGENLRLWRLKVTLGKNLPQLLSLYPLSNITYEKPFQYTERDAEGKEEKHDLSKEVSSALGYIVSLHEVYKDLKREAEMNALEKVALDRVTATEKTKDRKDMVNSGRTGDDDERDDGSNAGLLGYVEGDIAGITPEMSDLMTEMENTFRLLSGIDINEAEKLIAKGEFDISQAGLHAISDEAEYTAKDLSDITGTLVRLRESLPYLDEEFSGKRLSRDTDLKTNLSRITTVLKDDLRYNPYYTASELVNAIAGPGSMAALEGETSEAAMTRIIGSIADPSSAANVVSSIRASIEKTPTVFVNRYEGKGREDIAGFFSGTGLTYNVRGRKSRQANAMIGEVAAIKDKYESIPDSGSDEAKAVFAKGQKAAADLQKTLLFDSMNGIQKIIYAEKTNPAIIDKTNDFLLSAYGYMREGRNGLYLSEETEAYLSNAADTIRDSVSDMAAHVGMERGVDYMQELPTAAEFSTFIARMEGLAYRTDLENDRSYLDVFDEYYRLYRRSIDSQNAQIDAVKALRNPQDIVDNALHGDRVAALLEGRGLSASDISVSIDERKLASAGLSFNGKDEDSPSPLYDALMLYQESERRMRMLGQLRNIKDLGSIDMPGTDALERMKEEARKDRDERRRTLLRLLGEEREQELMNDIVVRFISSISLSSQGGAIDGDLENEIKTAIASDYAETYAGLCREADSYHELTDEIISNSETLRERNIDHLADEYRKIAEGQGMEIPEENLRSTVSIAVNSIWNRRKTAAAASKAVETFNQYAVRGLFDDKRDKVDYSSEESLFAFRNGAATFVSMKDVSTFVLETMPKQIEGLQKLYNANIRANALTSEEDKAFHDAHEQLVNDRMIELRKDMAGLENSLRRDERILDSPFSSETQYNLGSELRDILESTDINSLRGIDGRLEERRALKAEVVKAYEDMRDTLHAMMTDTPVRDPLTGENRPGDHPDLENRIFPVEELAKFLIKGQLEREAPGSYTYESRDIDWRFFNRLIDNAKAQIRESAAEWDRNGEFINPDDYTPQCITAYLEARRKYDSLLAEIGTDARFEEFRTRSAAFIRNNPLDPYSRAASNYLNAVKAGADENVLSPLYSEVVKSVQDAPYMGREAKMLHATNPEASREDIIATGREFMSDRDGLYQKVREEKDGLSRMGEELSFLSSSADSLFVIAGAAVPDYSQETEMIRDDIASVSLLQNVGPAMRESAEAASRGIGRILEMDWKDYRRELNPYHQALIARLSGRPLDAQLDMFASSLLAGPIPAPSVKGEGHDENGYWYAETDIKDPVFADSFDTVRNYIISINDGIAMNGHKRTDAFSEAVAAASGPRKDGLLGVRDSFINAYSAAVQKAGRELSKAELNGIFKDQHAAYIDYVRSVSERFRNAYRPFGMYFRTDGNGAVAYADRNAFRRMISSDERFREEGRGGRKNVSLGRFIEYSTLPKTITAPVRSPLLVKDLGTKAESDTIDRGDGLYSADAVITARGSGFYGINTKNMIQPGSSQRYYGLLFRTFGKNSISKEAVLAMLAMKTGAVEADRVNRIRMDYEKRIAEAVDDERKTKLEAAMDKAIRDEQRTMSYVRADLDPAKWDAVTPSGVSDGLSGLVMLVPNSELKGVRTADFIRRNALYVTEGRIDVRSGISLDGITGMRRFIESRMRTARSELGNRGISQDEARNASSIIESYQKELDALDSLERIEKSEEGKGILADRKAINRFITGEIDGRDSEFVASFDEYGRDAAVQKAVDSRNREYDSERNALLGENERLEKGESASRFNPLSSYGDAPRKPQGAGGEEVPFDLASRKRFLSAESFMETRVSAERRIDDMTQLETGEAVKDITPNKGRVPEMIKGVKDIFDIAFKPIDGKGTPLYRDPEKFGFLLSFIHDNFRSERPLSFCMTGGTLLDESFVSMADGMNLYESIANGEGENEITYLVYKKMFEAANVGIVLNTRDIVQLEDDGEDIRTDDAIDMSEREESGNRMDGGEVVLRSVELEHFAALEPELSEYGMNQERDNVQRTFAYQAELRNSMPDNSPGSIYGKLSIRGIAKFTEFFDLMDRQISGTITEDERSRLAGMLPKEILSLGDSSVDVTAEQVREWFRAWDEDRREDFDTLAPAGIPVDRKLFVIQSLLPMAGMGQVKEGSQAQRNTAMKVAGFLDGIAEMEGADVSWSMLRRFYDNVSYVPTGSDGLPDYRNIDIDAEALDEDTRRVLKPVMDNPERAGELYRILSTAGMEENTIPGNMDSVVEILSSDAGRPVSMERYADFFKEAFSEQLEDYRNSKALMDLFRDEENAERLAEGLRRLQASSRVYSPSELREEAARIVAGIAEENARPDFHIDVVPGRDEKPAELTGRIEKAVNEALEKEGRPASEKDSRAVSQLIADSFVRDSVRMADAIGRYVAEQKREADRRNEKLVVKVSAVSALLDRTMSGSMLSRSTFSERGLVEGIVRALGQAGKDGSYRLTDSAEDREAVLGVVRRALGESGYMDKALGACGSRLIAGSVPAVAAALKIGGEKWAELEDSLAWARGSKAETFQRAMERMDASPDSIIRNVFGLKTDLEDSIRRYASMEKQPRVFFIDPSLVSNQNLMVRDAILNARHSREDVRADRLMIPYAFVPTHGYADRNTGEWRFDRFVAVYSKERADELYALLGKYGQDDVVRAVMGEMQKRSQEMNARLQKADTPELLRNELRKILGSDEVERRGNAIRFFSSLTSSEISLLPDDVSLIPKTFDDSRIDPDYAGRVHQDVERQKEMEKAVAKEKSGDGKTSGLDSREEKNRAEDRSGMPAAPERPEPEPAKAAAAPQHETVAMRMQRKAEEKAKAESIIQKKNTQNKA